MKMRYLSSAAFLLLEVPILLPILAGAVIGGLLCGLQVAGERTRERLVGRHSPTPQPQTRVRPAAG